MNRTCIEAVFFALVFGLLSSCTIPAQLELHNATAAPIIVALGDVTTTIGPGEVATFSEIDLYGPSVRIDIGGKSFAYQFQRLPFSHIAWVGWGPFTKRVMRARIDQSGTIWALATDDKTAGTARDAQPEGFPIRPLESKTGSREMGIAMSSNFSSSGRASALRAELRRSTSR